MCDSAQTPFPNVLLAGAPDAEANDALTMLLSIFNDHAFWILGSIIAITAILVGGISTMVKIRSRERSRREIAAYIAEGSMTPEQGERLMKAAGDDA